MIINAQTRFYCDGQDLQCVGVVTETGEHISNAASVDTASGEVTRVNGMVDNLGVPLTSKTKHSQLYFLVTAGPSEQVVQEVFRASSAKEN